MKLKKNPKADISRWSNIFLLVGLAVMLLISWRAVEWKFYDKSDLIGDVLNVDGDVVNVRVRAPHPRLEQEAINVVKSLPKMTPGKQRDKAVGVLYALPIIFQVEN
jgi:hypothetical protein